jgi:hypothetical protein
VGQKLIGYAARGARIASVDEGDRRKHSCKKAPLARQSADGPDRLLAKGLMHASLAALYELEACDRPADRPSDKQGGLHCDGSKPPRKRASNAPRNCRIEQPRKDPHSAGGDAGDGDCRAAKKHRISRRPCDPPDIQPSSPPAPA